MNKFLRRVFRVLLVVALLVGGIAYWKREQITRLMAVNSLFDDGKIVSNFSHMDQAFLNTPVDRGDGPVAPLPLGQTATLPASVAPWVRERSVTSLLVLKQGKIVSEAYFLGTVKGDRRISWSMAKSFLSALFGVLMQEGAIGSLDVPATDYAPSLTGTAYDGASIRNVLNMASGVTFDEDYLDYDSDINRMGRAIALGGSLDGFTADLSETFVAPGEDWQYVSIDTHVIGMVVRGATGRSIPDLLSEKIIRPLGLETAPYYVTDGDGVAFVLGGLNLITRDYARFGQMFLQNGFFNGQQVVPRDWVTASTTASAPTGAGEYSYGYQW